MQLQTLSLSVDVVRLELFCFSFLSFWRCSFIKANGVIIQVQSYHSEQCAILVLFITQYWLKIIFSFIHNINVLHLSVCCCCCCRHRCCSMIRERRLSGSIYAECVVIEFICVIMNLNENYTQCIRHGKDDVCMHMCMIMIMISLPIFLLMEFFLSLSLSLSCAQYFPQSL